MIAKEEWTEVEAKDSEKENKVEFEVEEDTPEEVKAEAPSDTEETK